MPQRDAIRAEDVIAEVDGRWGSPCAACGAELVGQEVVIGMLMGLLDRLRCVACLAAELGRPPAAFARQAAANVRRLACYRAGWIHAERRLARAPAWPADRIPPGLRLEEEDTLDDDDEPTGEFEPSGEAETDPAPAALFDAGDMACGELVLKLRKRMGELGPGEVLELLARDPGAREDLPAWCRLTGHRLRAARPPRYLIEKRP